jgi:hypothetical protein
MRSDPRTAHIDPELEPSIPLFPPADLTELAATLRRAVAE